MMQSLYSAKTAMHAQQTRLDTIANNMANISTNGFKSNRVTFKDALYTVMANTEAQGGNLQQGNGVLVAATTKSFLQGPPVETGISMDFMIDGNGFFTVERDDGSVAYTRCGSFAVTNGQDGKYLATGQGYYVLDTDMKRIKLPEAADGLSAGADGKLSVGEQEPFAAFNIAGFSNAHGLEAAANNCFRATATSGEARKATGVIVKQGFLEGSNVDLSSEMVKLIRTQRAYSLSGKALTTAIEMDETANNMRA
ncbi:MAG: flagellar hook-basal body protein [Christensenellales bacterium]